MTFPGTATLHPTNENKTITPQAVTYGAITFPPAPISERVMLADATISQGNNEANRTANQYTGIRGRVDQTASLPPLGRQTANRRQRDDARRTCRVAKVHQNARANSCRPLFLVVARHTAAGA